MDTSTPQTAHAGDPHAWDRVKAALRRDWDQTRHDLGFKSGQDLNQGLGNTVGQATGNEALPSPHVANETDAWSDEAAVRYGYSVAQSPTYTNINEWSSLLEASLQRDWDATHPARPWSDVRMAVRYGWMRSKSPSAE